MGYRDSWLSNSQGVARHFEVFLHAMDREFPTQPARVLLAGVENGGTWDALAESLPAGSSITGIDRNALCGALRPETLIGDVLDRPWLNEALRGLWFDLVLDCTGSMTPHLWPWLRAGGRYIVEGYDTPTLLELLSAVADDVPGWLPTEEIMRVTLYPHVAVVEKRQPRVLPYIEIMTGNFAEVVPEAQLRDQGVRRVLLE